MLTLLPHGRRVEMLDRRLEEKEGGVDPENRDRVNFVSTIKVLFAFTINVHGFTLSSLEGGDPCLTPLWSES